jgi:2-polyprenyl-3-methyl-5-hydroxy-6-metoxy-1,4-benzoquinol methylase
MEVGMTGASMADARREGLVAQLSAAALGAMDLFCVYLGDRLGLYRALADNGALTSEQLAAAAAVSERYAREWLEQQAMSGILHVEGPESDDRERRYVLPAGHDEVLVEESSLSFTTPIAQLLVGCTRPLEAILEAFRCGTGVPFAAYGADMREGQARSSRILFDNLLASHWLPSCPTIHERLRADPPARVADLACGSGRSSLAIARGYPRVLVDGIDLDEASIADARELLSVSGVEDRVAFHRLDAAAPELVHQYDLVTMFEALHDMSYPVEVLRAARGMLVDGGRMLVADERTAERFSLQAGDNERLYYGFSVLHCLPVGMVGDNAAGTGTVMRPDALRQYATEAGFVSCEVLPIENDEWRFYLLAP